MRQHRRQTDDKEVDIVKELVALLIKIAKKRVEKEQESGFSEETYRLLGEIERLGVYL